jgi:hypothetical protein
MRRIIFPSSLTALVCLSATGHAASTRFHEIADDRRSGLADYHRAPSTTLSELRAFQRDGVSLSQFPMTPVKPYGAPGVALFDYDGDGDLDVYVTNGPGANNSLFKNLLHETGRLSFVDKGAVAGVGAKEQDSTGVCYGDIDNDGDIDLYVLGRSEPNILYRNDGNGHFTDITGPSAAGAGTSPHTSCSMGDINGDGLLDIVIANTFDWSSAEAVLVEPFADNVPDQLFLNHGGNVFEDVSVSSGVRNVEGSLPQFDGMSAYNWAVAMVDYDQDGDVDIVEATGQGAIPLAKYGGIDRGLIHLMTNDGTGHFVDRAIEAGTTAAGQWMGLSFGDVNHDGFLDFFGTNYGDWASTLLPGQYTLGDSTSRWWLGGPGGTFRDVGVGALKATGFGWGTSMFDYDNDGNTDIVFFGNFDFPPYTDFSNPGTVFHNDGTGVFTYDSSAVGRSVAFRVTQGVATGDLNQDGFVDIVSASEFNAPPGLPILPYPAKYGSVFDPPVASYQPVFTETPAGSGDFVWNGVNVEPGTVSVLVNSPDPKNGHVTVQTLGTVGLLHGGRVNRGGVGAIVRVTPAGGQPSLRPVMAGSSYQSADAPEGVFGLGAAKSATVEVSWPGGVRNRLYDVRNGERITFPELPCSIDESNAGVYARCVENAIDDLTTTDVLSRGEAARFERSAVRAFKDEHRGSGN